MRLTFAAALYVLRPRYVALGRAQGMTKEKWLSLTEAEKAAVRPTLTEYELREVAYWESEEKNLILEESSVP